MFTPYDETDGEICFAISIMICGCCVLFITIIYILNIRLFFVSDKVKHCSIKILTFITNTSGLTGSILLVYYISTVYTEKFTFGQPDMQVIKVLVGFFVNVLLVISVYSTFLLRLYHCFSSSIYSVPKPVYAILIILLFGYATAYIYVLYLLALLSDWGPPRNTLDIDQIFIDLEHGNTSITVIGTILNISMLLIFNGSLFRLMNTMKTSIHWTTSDLSSVNTNSVSSPTHSGVHSYDDSSVMSSPKSPSKVPDDYLNEKQRSLMRIVVRLTVLSTVSILSNIALHLCFIYIPKNHRGNFFAGTILRTVQCLYALIEVLDAFLNFSFNGAGYRKLCCCCIKCCFKTCTFCNYWYYICKEQRGNTKVEMESITI